MLLSLSRKTFLFLTLIATCSFSGVLADPVISDGSDGPFAPAGGIVTLNLPASGIFNFTTIDIPQGTIVKFNRNAQNTPVILAATGDVVISGQINISATATDVSLPPVPENPKQGSGPGGGDGGSPGMSEANAGIDGQGPGAGGGGYSAGGAGNATEGLQPTRYSTDAGMGAAGPVVAYPGLLRGGSGGGGGDAIYWHGWYGGGFGGGGGGAIQISTAGSLTLEGSILSDGANGGWAHASVLAHGGAGGGGSGGVIELYADSIFVSPEGSIQALGGYGGGLSTQPYSLDPPAYSSGANGGMGYVFFSADQITVEGNIEAVQIMDSLSPVPEVKPALAATLFQNRPNPFNPRTTIAFDLAHPEVVSLRVYDLAGRLVNVLLSNEWVPQGRREIDWNGRDRFGREVPSGTYFYRLENGDRAIIRNMTLVR